MSKYIGDLFDESNEHDRLVTTLLKESFRNNIIPSIFFFYKSYKVYPLMLESLNQTLAYITYPHVMKVLREEYNHDPKNDIVQYLIDNKLGFKYVTNQLANPVDGVMVIFSGGSLVENFEPICGKAEYLVEKKHHVFYSNHKFLYLPGKEEIVDKMIKSFGSVMLKEITEASLQMVCKNKCGFYLTSIKIKKPIITDLKLHYGEEFEKIHETILAALKSENSHGLILLHGLPGSGKTHYIRYLIQEISKKQLIYIPPDMTSTISSPEFFPFMLQQKDSVLIIEDAENIIRSRESKESKTQSVANLLNLSDGLLGDSLHQPIIATFNCELQTIDTALLRKGRLIAQYEFGKLNVENAQKLSDKLGFKAKISEPMTLADIYGQEKENASESASQKS